MMEFLLRQHVDALLPPSVLAAMQRATGYTGEQIAVQTIKRLVACGRTVDGASVNVLGLTSRDNSRELRNAMVVELLDELRAFGTRIFVHDPVADPAEVRRKYGFTLTPWGGLPAADATIVAVAHHAFLRRPLADLVAKTSKGGCFVDVKARFDVTALRRAGLAVWQIRTDGIASCISSA